MDKATSDYEIQESLSGLLAIISRKYPPDQRYYQLQRMGENLLDYTGTVQRAIPVLINHIRNNELCGKCLWYGNPCECPIKKRRLS